MPRISRAAKTEEEVLRRARAASECGDTIRPLHGEMAAVRRLLKRGLLVEAGVSVMWPHKLFALSKQGE